MLTLNIHNVKSAARNLLEKENKHILYVQNLVQCHVSLIFYNLLKISK